MEFFLLIIDREFDRIDPKLLFLFLFLSGNCCIIQAIVIFQYILIII